MRFHIGFSKRISIKKLIEFIGFLFVALLTFFGIYETTHAEVVWTSLDNESYFVTPVKYEYLDYNDNFNLKSNTSLGVYRSSGLVQVSYNNSSSMSNWYNYPYAFSQYAHDNTFNSSYFNHTRNDIFQSLSFKYEPSYPICVNNTNSLKSANFQISLYNSFSRGNTEEFNLPSDFEEFVSSVQGVTFVSHSTANNQEYNFSTTCTFNKIYNNYVIYDCNNVFNGNNDYPVDYYTINIINTIPFNNLYSNSTSVNAYVTNYLGFYAPSSSNDNTPFRFSCSDDPPVIMEPLPSDDDPAGLNDIYDKIKDQYNDNIGGIGIVSSPNNYLELINLPFDLFRALINSNDNVCTPYEIDLSSIMQKWGDSNSSYTLRLPCMRTTLINIIGNNLYNTLDLLICFYLVYKIMMFIVRSISAVLSGEDLFDFYFGGSSKNDKE